MTACLIRLRFICRIQVVYITDRIITLSHPHMQSDSDGDITADRKLAAVGHLLQKRHGGKYMVWNLSEVEYDATVLDDQVLVYKFPGSVPWCGSAHLAYLHVLILLVPRL